MQPHTYATVVCCDVQARVCPSCAKKVNYHTLKQRKKQMKRERKQQKKQRKKERRARPHVLQGSDSGDDGGEESGRDANTRTHTQTHDDEGAQRDTKSEAGAANGHDVWRESAPKVKSEDDEMDDYFDGLFL